MANTYCTATNTGKGFLTHHDRNMFDVEAHIGDIYVVENNNHGISWINRVGGTAKVKADAQAIVDAKIEEHQASWDNLPEEDKAPIFPERVRPEKYTLP